MIDYEPDDDIADIADAQVAIADAEASGTVPWEQVKAELGLNGDDE